MSTDRVNHDEDCHPRNHPNGTKHRKSPAFLCGFLLGAVDSLVSKKECDRMIRDDAQSKLDHPNGMSFCISGLPAERFIPLFALDDAELAPFGAHRTMADERPGFPCRVTLADAERGERVLLLNYEHQPANTPYRAAHAIYVRESAVQTARAIDTIPESLRLRMLSVRAFDAAGMMRDADLTPGAELATLIERFLADPATAYLHVHFAKRGCYAARVDRHEIDF